MSDLDSLEASLAATPRDATLWRAHGEALWKLRRVAEALASFEAALALDGQDVRAHVGRGDALAAAGRHTEALESYDSALRIDGKRGAAWRGRGAARVALGLFAEADADYSHALGIDAQDCAALYDRAQVRGLAFRDMAAAAADLERLIAIDPDYDYALGDLVHARMQMADWRDLNTLIARVTARVRAGASAATPFVFQALSSSPADLQICATLYAQRNFPEGPRTGGAHSRGEKIRVGYLAGEFHAHATAFLTAGVFEHHDKQRFEIFAFDNGVNDGSALRRRLEAAFDHVIDIRALSDGDAAARIAAAEIDILINLNGYFGRGRMGVFARRAAPIQVNYLGFPGTLGAAYMDYIIADAHVIAPAQTRFFTEQVVTLPESYQANDDKRAIAAGARRADHGLPEDAVVLVNFNQTYKLTPEIFAAWMRILRGVDKAVLWLWAGHAKAQDNLRAAAEAQGVAGERLIFAGDAAHEEHLARLSLADLYLDTLPYNAHTGASDALWAGVPLVTLRGEAFAGRVAASLLSAVGIPELVTESLADYEALITSLACDGERLTRLRAVLANKKMHAPLFDTARFTRGLEAAYTRIVDIHRRAEPPRGFAVPPL